MTRAQIADPHMVEKLAAGREEQVRPCVGATHCQSPYRPSCLHNPVTGRETVLRHVIEPTSGPSAQGRRRRRRAGGLEAARVSAERGHDVVLYEAAADVGGQVLLGATGSWRRDLIGIVEWRVAELERRGVPIHTNSYMEAADIAALAPDVVILATGGLPQIDILEGSDLCVSTWDIVSGQTPVGRDVLVYDGTGRHPAPLAAERAKEGGANVTYATIDANLADELTYAERLRWKKRFLSLGLRPVSESRLVAVRRRDNRLHAVLLNEISREERIVLVDQVIVEQGSIPMNELFEELRAASSNEGVTDIESFVRAAPQPRGRRPGFELHRIGDAVSSRNIHAAMLDAVRICSPL